MPIDGAVTVADAGVGGHAGENGGVDGDPGDGSADDSDAGGADGNSGDGSGDGADGDSGDQEFEIDSATGEPKLDDEGNPVPKAITPVKTDFKKSYTKLKEVDSAAAEVYRKEHFHLDAYKQSFPTSKDARVAKDLLDTYGGADGIENISKQAQAFADEMDKFSSGDQDFLSQLAKTDSDGFAKSMTNGVSILGQVNKEAYNALATPIVNASLKSYGITDGIVEAGNIVDRVYASLEKAGVAKEYLPYLDQALKALNSAYDGTDRLRKLGEASGHRELTDKEKQLQQREQQLNDTERQTFISTAQSVVHKNMNASIVKALQPYYKQFPKITADQKADLEDGVYNYINSQLDSNSKYITQVKTLMKEGNMNKLTSYMLQNINKLVQGAAKTKWNHRGFGVIPNSKKQASSGGTIITIKPPKNDDIWWEKDGGPTTQLMYMSGRAILKSTKKAVKWDWEKV